MIEVGDNRRLHFIDSLQNRVSTLYPIEMNLKYGCYYILSFTIEKKIIIL